MFLYCISGQLNKEPTKKMLRFFAKKKDVGVPTSLYRARDVNAFETLKPWSPCALAQR